MQLHLVPYKMRNRDLVGVVIVWCELLPVCTRSLTGVQVSVGYFKSIIDMMPGLYVDLCSKAKISEALALFANRNTEFAWWQDFSQHSIDAEVLQLHIPPC